MISEPSTSSAAVEKSQEAGTGLGETDKFWTLVPFDDGSGTKLQLRRVCCESGYKIIPVSVCLCVRAGIKF